MAIEDFLGADIANFAWCRDGARAIRVAVVSDSLLYKLCSGGGRFPNCIRNSFLWPVLPGVWPVHKCDLNRSACGHLGANTSVRVTLQVARY